MASFTLSGINMHESQPGTQAFFFFTEAPWVFLKMVNSYIENDKQLKSIWKRSKLKFMSENVILKVLAANLLLMKEICFSFQNNIFCMPGQKYKSNFHNYRDKNWTKMWWLQLQNLNFIKIVTFKVMSDVHNT